MKESIKRILFLSLFIFYVNAEIEDETNSLTRAAPDVKNPVCPNDEKCKNEMDCKCEKLIANDTIRRGFKRFCTNGLCEYCAERHNEEERSACAFGDTTNPSTLKYVPCCRALGGKYTDHPNNAISCIPTAPGPRPIVYLCQTPCGPLANPPYKLATCQDKDGYTPNVHFKGNCTGSKPNTWTACQSYGSKPKECGITGAPCSKNAYCCNGFKCDGTKCAIKCTGEGTPCGVKGTTGCCLTYMGKKLICKKRPEGDPLCKF